MLTKTTHSLLYRSFLGAVLAGVLVQEIGIQLMTFVRTRELKRLAVPYILVHGFSINAHLYYQVYVLSLIDIWYGILAQCKLNSL